MQWEFVVALIIAIPIILFPAAFVWYLNVGGLYAAIKGVRERRTARAKGKSVVPGTEDQTVTETVITSGHS